MSSDSVELSTTPEATGITPTNDDVDASIKNGLVSDPRRDEDVTSKKITDERNKASFCSEHLETSARKSPKYECVKKPWKDRSVYFDLVALNRSMQLPKIVLKLDELWKLNQIYERKVSEEQFEAHLLRCVVNRHWTLLLILKETFEEKLDTCQRLIESSKRMRAVALARGEFGGFRGKKRKQGKKNYGNRNFGNPVQNSRARKNFRKTS
ncbi:hypothetical protein METSCH_F03730 [Metschnikowia aff. pulcherrima]|uniref:Uncharacterized protein n=1 Tax=Metschnikowia aff. pulcherrima TaxID=2163413 RepID=A0A4P6XW33_9ASCO|nr:hypothetical protein METSCH_F03730 [Metschnikowia aff. pulcherrima]